MLLSTILSLPSSMTNQMTNAATLIVWTPGADFWTFVVLMFTVMVAFIYLVGIFRR